MAETQKKPHLASHFSDALVGCSSRGRFFAGLNQVRPCNFRRRVARGCSRQPRWQKRRCEEYADPFDELRPGVAISPRHGVTTRFNLYRTCCSSPRLLEEKQQGDPLIHVPCHIQAVVTGTNENPALILRRSGFLVFLVETGESRTSPQTQIRSRRSRVGH